MELYISGKHRALIAEFSGELDHHAAREARKLIDRTLQRSGAINLIFDFRHLTLMDSSGIGIIMGRYKVVNALGGKIIICGASNMVKRIINMPGIKELVIMSDKLEDALKEAAKNVQK